MEAKEYTEDEKVTISLQKFFRLRVSETELLMIRKAAEAWLKDRNSNGNTVTYVINAILRGEKP